MINVSIKVFENGPGGLHVTLFARGAAKSEREQIYHDKLKPAIQQALLDAGAEVARQGLAAELSEEFKSAVADQAPAPIGANAVEIKLSPPVLPPPSFVPVPPSFPDFVSAIVAETRRLGRECQACDLSPELLGGCARSAIVESIASMLVERGQGFLDAQIAFVAWAKRQENKQGGN